MRVPKPNDQIESSALLERVIERVAEMLLVRLLGGDVPHQEGRHATLEPSTMASNPEWLWLSPVESRIVEALGTHWLSAPEIAEKIREPASGQYRVILSNLVKRRILLSNQRMGYRVNLLPVEEATP